MKKQNKLYYLWICLLFASVSCTKKPYTSDIYIVKQWKIVLSAIYTIPANVGRTDHAVAMVFLMSNNQLSYDYYFDANLNNNDTPTDIQLYTGSATENGTLLLDLHNAAFNSSREIKGDLPLDNATVAQLLSYTNTVYTQVTSAQVPTGLVRGQMDRTIVTAYDIPLTKYNSTVVTPATGVAYIRVFSDNTLSTQVVVNNQPVTDALTLAHIHKTLDNSTSFVLAASAADFNKAINSFDTGRSGANAPLATSLSATSSDLLYVDVHSTLYPGGLLKGTIR
jgi:hypothetical protein